MDIKTISGGLPCGIIPFSAVNDKLNNYAVRSKLPKNPQAVILLLFPYYLGEAAYSGANISRYAVSKDYHKVVCARLEEICKKLKAFYPNNEFIIFCDSSPIPEKLAAAMAGLGVIGKNSLLINKDYGSYCFIGSIVTDISLEHKTFRIEKCSECGNCIKLCPSGAISESGVSAELCISAISQKKGKLSEAEKALLKKTGLVWGCDECQTCCPMNKNIKITPVEEFIDTAIPVFTKQTSLTDRAYSWRGKEVLERNHNIIYEGG